MFGYILRRLIATAPVMLIVAVFVFLMLRLTPGDPAAIIAGDNANAEQIAAIRNRLGLDEPIVTQFFIWLGGVLPAGTTEEEVQAPGAARGHVPLPVRVGGPGHR